MIEILDSELEYVILVSLFCQLLISKHMFSLVMPLCLTICLAFRVI